MDPTPRIRTPIDPRWAWERYQPDAATPWDLRRAGHLYRRAGFGANRAELLRAVEQGPERTLDALLRESPEQEAFERETAQRLPSIVRGNNGELASAWWLYRLAYAPQPLRDKLTLFWHNHFATSNRKVNDAGFMLGQYELLRRHARGNFRALLEAMSTDPAMMVWLDTAQSQRQAPNENYARELMELFSLGILDPTQPGRRNYSEQDIRAAARAFTGWRVENGQARFHSAEHDDGEKTIFGQTGRWQPNDIVRLCLDQPAAPYFVVGKLFRFLVSETLPITPTLLEPLAVAFRRSDYDFGALVERVLRSNLFFSPLVYRTRVKSPLDFTLGLLRALDGRVGTLPLVAPLEGLGQRPFYPPSVAGWDGGRSWLNAQTLLLRHNLALSLISTEDDRFGNRVDPAALVRAHGRTTPEEQVGFFLELFLQDDVDAATRDRLLAYARQPPSATPPVYWSDRDAENQRVRTLCHLVLTLPEFQLD